MRTKNAWDANMPTMSSGNCMRDKPKIIQEDGASRSGHFKQYIIGQKWKSMLKIWPNGMTDAKSIPTSSIHLLKFCTEFLPFGHFPNGEWTLRAYYPSPRDGQAIYPSCDWLLHQVGISRSIYQYNRYKRCQFVWKHVLCRFGIPREIVLERKS